MLVPPRLYPDILNSIQPRFAVLMKKLPCRPFEDTVDPEEIELGQREPSGTVNPYVSPVL